MTTKTTQSHIIFKLHKIKGKGKKQLTCRRTEKNDVQLLLRNHTSQKRMDEILKLLREKKQQLRMQYPSN